MFTCYFVWEQIKISQQFFLFWDLFHVPVWNKQSQNFLPTLKKNSLHTFSVRNLHKVPYKRVAAFNVVFGLLKLQGMWFCLWEYWMRLKAGQVWSEKELRVLSLGFYDLICRAQTKLSWGFPEVMIHTLNNWRLKWQKCY